MRWLIKQLKQKRLLHRQRCTRFLVLLNADSLPRKLPKNQPVLLLGLKVAKNLNSFSVEEIAKKAAHAAAQWCEKNPNADQAARELAVRNIFTCHALRDSVADEFLSVLNLWQS